MNIFAMLACAALVWLTTCVAGENRTRAPARLIVTWVAAVILSLWVFGAVLFVGIRASR
jgi:hypothetical protein